VLRGDGSLVANRLRSTVGVDRRERSSALTTPPTSTPSLRSL
jgi:hypothetical protein